MSTNLSNMCSTKKMQWIQFIIIWKVYDATVPASESHKRKYYPWNKVIEYKAWKLNHFTKSQRYEEQEDPYEIWHANYEIWNSINIF